ncbi:MAG: SDR family NAD(P)-dependent oxidoreductase [Propionibacteriaceae bacterium]
MTPSLALVTGASSGIGRDLARELADDGYDLFLSAEDAGLDAVVAELVDLGSVVGSLRADLRTGEGVEELYAAVVAGGRPLDVAMLNAGIGRGGAFVDTPLAEELDVIRLNVLGTVHLAKLVLDDMVARNAGRVLITSSVASTMPGAYQTTYNASKSFLQSFSEALQSELSESEVVVTSLMPGPTETNFFHRAGMADTPIGKAPKDDSRQVARQGYEALQAGKRKVVGGSRATKAMSAATGVLPDAVKVALHKAISAPRQ